MKIAVITSLYAPYTRGGAEVVAQMIVDELKKEHDVIVITLSPWKGFSSLLPKMTHEDGVRIYRFYPKNIFSFINIAPKPFFLRFFWHIGDLFNIHGAWTVFHILQKEKPDCVMMHGIKGMGYTIPFVVKKTGIPHMLTLHDVQYVVPSGQYLYGHEHTLKTSVALRLYRALTRQLLGSPRLVLYPSFFLRDFYDGYGFFSKSKKIVLSNPVQMPIQMHGVRLLQNGEPMRFLYLGQLERHKGLLFLLDVFQKWHAPHVRLIIAGKGSCETIVRTASAGDTRISYVGFVSGNAREELFQDAHFVIVPSLCYENAPLVIGEALCRGIPVITARIGGAHELVYPGKNGYVFLPNDQEDCMRTLFEAKDALYMKYAGLSRAAQESAQEYAVKKYCKKIFGFN